MNRIPIITGLGLVTPLGSGVGDTWSALMAGKHIMTHARSPLDAASSDRVHYLAVAAAREALRDARWTQKPSASRPVPGSEQSARGRAGSIESAGSPSDSTVGLVVGTSKGAVDAWLNAPPENSLLGSVAAHVRDEFPLLDGPALTLSAACASGLHALIRASLMIRSGEAQRVLVVAAEASVHPLFLGNFQRLGVLPREGVGCRPFDQERSGFLMSEAAAAICLEPAEADGEPNRSSDRSRPYARVDRFALSGDATHMTGGDPGAATLRQLLRTVIDKRPVELIHAHGTGTIAHDPIELSAFEAECAIDGHDGPAVYSHKGALGHSLGASGLVSTVLSCLMHRDGIVLPNVQTRRPLPTQRVSLGRESVQRRITRSIAVASGFGGAMGAVSLHSA